MRARAAGEALLGVLLVLLVGSLLLGQLLGQPILLGYVETGSMAPTMQPNDGFVAIPPALAGPIEEGDVITFDAKTLHGGRLTTHRVVEVTERGFITKGDANPVTDQDSGEPPVSREQVVAVALQVGGETVVVPNLGLLVTGVSGALAEVQRRLAVLLGTRAVLGSQGLAYLLFAAGAAAYAASELLASGGPDKTRSRTRRTGTLDAPRVVGVLTVLVVALVTASMVVPAGTQSFTVVSSQTDAPGARVIGTGTTENVTYVVPSTGLIPTVVYLEPATEGVTVSPRRLAVPGSAERNATVTLSAPPDTGTYQRAFTEHRYLAVLPASTIDALYRAHPWLPIVVIDLLVGVGFAGVGAALVGRGPVRVDARGATPPLRTRLRRFFK